MQVLSGKSVIVTGVGPGLGRTVALEAARHGAMVAMVSRSTAIMDEVASEVRAAGGRALVVQADITKDEDCARAVSETEAAFGKVDGLVNSAYRPGDLGTVCEIDLVNLAAAFDVTVLGTMRMIRAVVPAMERQGGGAIVNVGSQVTRKFVPHQGGYAATKAALATLTRYLAVELGPKNIRVNTPAIGWTLSEPAKAWLEEQAASGGPTVAESIAGVAANMALGRIPTDEECARGILLPLSDLCSAMTGATLDFNGGDYMPL